MKNNLEAGKQTIRMLIVDDEPVICQGLRCTIDWEKLGIEVAGEAYDGEEALQLTEEQQIDLLLTDIRMEGMDGLELTAQLKRRYPHVRVIMISGYEDFDYARQAVRLHVSDYLLKPVDIDELVTVVRKVAAEIRDDKDMESGQNDAQRLSNEVLWLSNMVRNVPSYDRELPPHLQGEQYRIIAMQIDQFSVWRTGLSNQEYTDVQQQWLQSIGRRLEKHSLRCISVFDHINLLFTLVVADRLLEREEWDRALAEAVRPMNGDIRLYCAASRPYERLDDTADYCMEARRILEHHVLDHAAVVLLSESRERAEVSRTVAEYNSAGRVQLLAAALFKQDTAEVQQIVREMFLFFRERDFLLNEVVKACEEVAILLRQRLRQSGLTELDHGRGEPVDPYVYNSYEAIEALVNEEMLHLLRLMGKNGMDKSYWIIEKAKKYMQEQYSNELKAFEVAAWLKITPSYFSYIFKQSTSKSFTEYVNELRIDHAKRLLATTHDKVFEIADKVGYKEYKYFVSVFKAHTGMTPKEFRALNVRH
ncbi:response regulator [Paenibacillus sp. P96]|uniref:Response regulator n=1 Tax=Paenibacillus zeirhizosphaerae TaxID=2987519 RepID=A0ABT9FU31_9BACL|nr:response regulator [Paenibacillus sp. P96]MDP4098237.1 response regulator [Paenibacillus sp. P96]